MKAYKDMTKEEFTAEIEVLKAEYKKYQVTHLARRGIIKHKDYWQKQKQKYHA